MHTKLFIPGPIEVLPELLQAQTKPMIGHRGGDYQRLHGGIVEKFKQYMGLKSHEVFIFASSATGVMEGAVRNCIGENDVLLHTVCGAFSERWLEISRANGKKTDVLEVEWGQAIKPEMLREKLVGTSAGIAKTPPKPPLIKGGIGEGRYKAVTITHNETSTGVMNPLKELIDVCRGMINHAPTKENPLIFVDAVSSFAGTVIKPEELGIDILIFGTQKCMGLPPGLAFGVVSPRVLEIAAQTNNRGNYFDFLEMKKYSDRNETPATPAISLLYALDIQLDRLLKEGMEARAGRHLRMALTARAWCAEHGFELLPEKGYESSTMTAARNTPNIDIKAFRAKLKERGYVIADGYGKMKGLGFRIGHMGDWEVQDLDELLKTMNEVL